MSGSANGDFDAFLFEMAGRSLSWVYEFWHSHEAGHSSTAATVRPTPCSTGFKRRAIGRRGPRSGVAELARILHEDPPAAFLAWQTTSRAVSTKFDVGVRRRTATSSTTCGSGGRGAAAAGGAMRRITSRFVLLIATAAVLPLVVYGSSRSARCAAAPRPRCATATRKVAKQVAEQIRMYMQHNTRVLQSVGTELGATDLARVAAGTHPQGLRPRVSRVPRDHRLRPRPARPLATSAIGDDPAVGARAGAATAGPALHRAADGRRRPAADDDDRGPPDAVAAGRRLDRRRDLARRAVADGRPDPRRQRGYALIVGEDGRLIAHGNPDEKRHIADADQSRRRSRAAVRGRVPRRQGPSTASTRTATARRCWRSRAHDHRQPAAVDRRRRAAAGRGAGARRAARAAAARRHPRSRCSARSSLGYLWGRSFIQRIFALTRVTRAIAEGKLETASRSAGRTRSASSATRSTRWPTASSSCRRTSASRNAR